ncbi:Twinfilin [Strongyloides ratti]|uniref:Twinfilin n=1 Tax=Strongyloides ratti TaxID=34506 RepID=A0A090MMW7_STRRB|nr:Twinfilin [Strongyloides ratti]CEF59376.1 Twinfilin [Strongyloides ratti]
MAYQTGIRADSTLLKFFEQCKEGKVRMGKIVIKKEVLSVNYQYEGTNDWKADWSAIFPQCLDSFEPCYILFRLTEKNEWIFVTFADDLAPVREKMPLAATRATFMSEFGQSFIIHNWHFTNKHDFDLDKIERRIAGISEKPMTEVERQLDYASRERAHVPLPNIFPMQTLRGCTFPIDRDALNELENFKNGLIDFVQLSIDTLNEAIKLEETKDKLDVSQLQSAIPKKQPRYSFYRYHNKADDSDKVFFIYSLPPSAEVSVKERMLYSSCKLSFLDNVKNECNIDVSKKIEVDSKDKLDDATLSSYFAPEEPIKKQNFIKPAPPSKTPRRLIRDLPQTTAI